MLQIEQLYIEYKKDVYYYLLSLTHDSNLSEDLLSETFIQAMKSLLAYRGDAAVKTWLFGIARNVWLQQLRKKRDTVQYDDLMEVYVSERMEDHLLNKEALRRVEELLHTKDEKARTVVTMRLQGFSYEEIAGQIGITTNSARVIDFRIKKWLRETLKEEGLV